ncbi:NADPh quinone reductase [Phlyctochytrium bullatum]|nr:NADPh quinone reductase [Phlyctochytrium bullatum]
MSATTMQAAVVTKYGGPDVLEYATVPKPTLEKFPDSVIVKVDSAGVNPVDYKIARGDLSFAVKLKFPAIVGLDYAGQIVEVGPNVTGFAVGDHVYGRLSSIAGTGSHAEYIRATPVKDTLYKRPPNLSATDAAGVATVTLTAYVGLVSQLGLSLDPAQNEGKSVLVIGASGGVGAYAVKIAKRLGAKVTGVASGRNKDYVVNELKVDTFIDYTTAPIEKQLTVASEFDVVYDAVGGDKLWVLSQTILKPGGLFVTAVGPLEFGDGLSFGAFVGFMGSFAWRYAFSSRRYRFVADLPSKDFENIDKWFAEGSLTTTPTEVIPLKDAKVAFEKSASHRTVGKLVLKP